MKKLILFAGIALFAVSCNNKDERSDVKATDSTGMADNKPGDIVYPYALDRPYQDWQPNDQKHAVTVMSALKGFENGDIPACMAGFGDSVEIYFDNYEEKMSKDSLTKFFTEQRAQYKTMKIKMEDWESMRSKDKKEQWVTLWYKQWWTDIKGKSDSLEVVNDAKIVNDKIVLLDENTRHYPARKK